MRCTMMLASLTVSILILGSCSFKKNETGDVSESASTKLTPQEFQEQLLATPDAVLIDVRKPEEVAEGIIGDAINIDFTDPTFQTKIDSLDKAKPYFVYCKSGKRSAGAAAVMEKLGFEKIYILDGGYTRWVDSGFESREP
jgi:rhodanese-related sulfurtransferase